MEWTAGDYVLTDDPARADIEAIHRLLRETYWAATRQRETVVRSVQHSLCFSLFHGGSQVGVARVLTDQVTTSYLCDVVIDAGHRGRGMGAWLIERILDHPAVKDTRVLLITRDAQDFYQGLGFSTHPYECMVKRHPLTPGPTEPS
jgi:N-acetylglutamate synthase-like GNAT family acetyltransferase